MGHKFLSFYKEEKKRGFARRVPRVIGKEVNVGELDELYGKIGVKTPEGDMLIDLNAYGYSKLLGSGEVSSPYVVKVAQCSEKARLKIEAVGGRIVKPGEA